MRCEGENLRGQQEIDGEGARGLGGVGVLLRVQWGKAGGGWAELRTGGVRSGRWGVGEIERAMSLSVSMWGRRGGGGICSGVIRRSGQGA